MKMRCISAKTLAAVVFAASLVPAVAETELNVNYNWTSPAETAAINVLKARLAERGIKWNDFAVVQHDTGANISVINMIAGGTPPDVFLSADPGLYRDIKGMGHGFPLDAIFAEVGATPNFADAVKKSITVDDEIVKAPVAIHIDGMLFYNKEVAAKAGVDPTKWTSMDDVWADFDKIKAAGFIPIAIGSQKWQEGYLFHALMAAFGSDIYDGFYAADPDTSTFTSDSMRKVLGIMRQFQQHTDEGSTNRDWNVTTGLVISGQALMQIHGDWMKGEFRAAGKEAGKDFGCINIPGASSVSVTVDAWGFYDTGKPEVAEAQKQFASVVVDPAISAEFAAKKGSTPVVLNAPTEHLDECNQIVLETLKDPARQHQNPHNTADADWFNATWDVIDRFWTDPNMTEDQAMAQFQEAYDAVF
jgi:glucose/mannose transport system substrate-binding protein